MKKILLGSMLLSVLFISSCTVYVKDRAYVPVEQPSYYTLRVYDDRYVFYSADEPVAVWTFAPDGTFIKEGIIISGPVRVYYQPDVLFAETYYVNGYRDGECRYYYPGGGLMYSGFYRRGYMSGAWASYNAGGGISASFQFHGTETVMPAGFQQPADPAARAGFQSMQREAAYAGKPVVNQPFNRSQAVQANYHNSFGAMPAHASGNVQAQGIQQGRHPEVQAGNANQGNAEQAPVVNKGQKKNWNKKQFNRQKPGPGNIKNGKKIKQPKNKFKPVMGQNGKNAPGEIKDGNIK